MKSYSNTYIFMFSLILVTIVAVLLSFVAMQLKPRQDMNVELERKANILNSVGMAEDMGSVKDKTSFINGEFEKYITDSYVVDYAGEKVDKNAFNVTLNIKEETDKPVKDRNFPVFEFTSQDGMKKYIVPVRGKGLWGPIWGYVSFNSDMNTIFGAVYDHAKETPGLGAEINTDWFEKEFQGKKIFDDSGKFVSIQVVKGGASPDDPHAVDAISGGTITSKGLQAMLSDCFEGYANYFQKVRESN